MGAADSGESALTLNRRGAGVKRSTSFRNFVEGGNKKLCRNCERLGSAAAGLVETTKRDDRALAPVVPHPR
ncbi:hypothetical protein C8D88_10274 [Lentzea atacamensis]|uniref:Uncharacterized protein n=2 Tax=Lentzea TaxID=165301 RepID=A0A316IER0_9PSEU|nr:hypothetical protein C8D88_10274 [Lentzea atacamensis]